MTQILVTKPGTLTAGDRRKLRAAGVVTVEAESPQDVRLIGAEGPPLDGGDMLFAAVQAMAQAGENTLAQYVKRDFVAIIAKLLGEKRNSLSEQPQ